MVFSPVNNSPASDNFANLQPPFDPARPQACAGCAKACRQRLAGGIGNESSCAESAFGMSLQSHRDRERAGDLLQAHGLNAAQMGTMISYLAALQKAGVLGPGKEIPCDLPFDLFGTLDFLQTVVRKTALREGVGDLLSTGFARAAAQWGRYKKDTDAGVLNSPNWGYMEHYEPRVEVEWSYGSILSDRDINEHSLNFPLHHMPSDCIDANIDPIVPAEKLVEIMASKVAPYAGDPFMFDYSEGPTGIYSDHRVKTIAWHRHYTRFWTQSALYCDWVWPLFFTPNAADMSGATPEGEPRFFNAVTGRQITFEDGVETGRKIWNLDRSIWILQGRHRDMEVHSGYVYGVPTKMPYYLPVYENGKWSYSPNIGRVLSKPKFEEWKTKFYEFEGWNAANGWPKSSTLEILGLKKVADVLKSKGKLG
jgi:aldehyde:ferredoxin oxidoreductase